MTDNTDNQVIVWDEIQKRFRAYLTVDGRHSCLGSFRTVDDAAMARTQAAWLYIEQFAANP
jgi:hypothetical protein